MRHYRRSRRDANHGEIVGALKAGGASVADLSSVGGGCPDVLVGLDGIDALAEIKNPNARRGQQGTGLKTAEKQALFKSEWRGRRVALLENVGDAIRLLTEMRQ